MATVNVIQRIMPYTCIYSEAKESIDAFIVISFLVFITANQNVALHVFTCGSK